MSFSGKKWKKVNAENIIEFIDALKLSEKIRALLRQTDSVSSFTKNANGSYTYKVEVAGKVILEETFTLNSEYDYTRPDGITTKNKFILDGESLKQTMTSPDGKTVYLDRSFEGDKMKLTVTADGVDVTGYVHYQAV